MVLISGLGVLILLVVTGLVVTTAMVRASRAAEPIHAKSLRRWLARSVFWQLLVVVVIPLLLLFLLLILAISLAYPPGYKC